MSETPLSMRQPGLLDRAGCTPAKPTILEERLRMAARKRELKAAKLRKELPHG